MVSKKRAGILAAVVVAAVGFGMTFGGAAQAATRTDPGTGFASSSSLTGAASCNTTTGTWSIAWTFSYTSDAPSLAVTVVSASAGGIVPGVKTITAAQTTPATFATVTFPGTSTGHANGASITQTVNYEVPTFGTGVPIKVSLAETVVTPTTGCVADPTTTTTSSTTSAPTTTAAPTTTVAAVVTTQELVTTTTAKATTTTKAAVLAATALPSTGSNSGMVIAVGFAFGIVGVTLVRMDRKRKLYA
jgi:hypothetical protein